MTSSPASTSRTNSKDSISSAFGQQRSKYFARSIPVGGAVEREVVGQTRLDHAAIAGLVGPVAVADELQPVISRHLPLP